MLTLRFDMRAPASGAPVRELYAAAIAMAAWAESRGGVQVVLSEHHATDDGHLPSPLILAAAIAARTEKIGILLAALVLPFRDPVLLAEEMCVLDIVSNGRVGYVMGIGHRFEEYAHMGADPRRRGKAADEKLALLFELLKGEPVVRQGRTIHVTPPPLTPGGPRVLIAGGSVAAARRAGRFGLGLIAQANAQGMMEAYRAECEANGHKPGFVKLPDPAEPTAIFVADNVAAAWDEIGSYLLHDARAAAAFRQGEAHVASISQATSVAQLRAENGAYRIVTTAQATERLKSGKSLGLLPLCGGMPPAIAWPYLERAALAVVAAHD